MKDIFDILKNYKLNKKLFFLSLLLWVLMEIIYSSYPQIVRKLMEIIEKSWNVNLLLFWWWFWIFLWIIVSFLWYYSEVIDEKLWGIIYKEKSLLYKKKLFEKSYSQIVDEWTWKLIAKFSRWIEAEANIFNLITVFLTDIFVRILLVFIVLAYFFPPFILLLLALLLVMTLLNFFIKKKITKLLNYENQIFKEDTHLKVRSIANFLLIKIFNKENYEINKTKEVLSKLPDLRANIHKYQILFYIFLFFLIKSLEIWIYSVLWYYVIKWDFSIAFLVMMAGYLWMIWYPIDKWINLVNNIIRQLEAYRDLQEFIKKTNPIKDWSNEYKYKNWKVEFKNVYFSYWDKTLFENLNLTFLPWKKNALVWHSWWWKSTIIKILLRFFDYQKGEVLVDDQDLKQIKISSFYKHIGYLSQEPDIFDGTIRENLEYAFDKDISSKEKEKIMWEALKKAQIDEKVRQLDKQLDTPIWEKGVKLSWWEKQRLAIARLFIKNPKIIILDEPTSALDSLSEYKITKALDELTKWKTSIIIAHRLQTVMKADQIIVLENWKVDSVWKHNELIKKSKIYKTLVDLQNGILIE